MTTIKDVAERAQVSVATVSRVITGSAVVSDEVTRRVQVAMSETGYRPNRLARGLRRQVSMVWGLLISDVQNPFFTGLVRAVEDVAHENGYSLVLCNSDEDVEKEGHYIDVLLDEKVSGLLITPEDENHTSVQAALDAHIPVVAVDRRVLTANVDTVLVDNKRGARELVEHMIDNGAENIAVLLGDLRVTPHRERLEGYHAALRSRRVKFRDDLVLVARPHNVGARESMMHLFGGVERPDGLFITNNQLAIVGLHALDELDLAIPDDVRVGSFDDPPLAALLRPGLTVVRQPTYDLGRRAAELLLDRIRQPHRPPKEILLTPELVIRGSTQLTGRR